MSLTNQMVSVIETNALDRLFLEARSFSEWQSRGLSEDTLRRLYELVRWGPTSMNSAPARFRFLHAGPARDRLIECLDKGNVSKTRTAPVTVIVAYDLQFHTQLPRLFKPGAEAHFAEHPQAAQHAAQRNSAMQGAYLIMAARALGLDCGPMSGFDAPKVDDAFFAGTSLRTNFLCNLGYGDRAKLHPRRPRLSFEEACSIA